MAIRTKSRTPSLLHRCAALCITSLVLLFTPGEAPAGHRDAPVREYFIEAPNGGDCKALQGTWADNSRTCSIPYLTLQTGDTLTVRRDATLTIIAQFVNSGTVFIRAGDPTGSAQLVLGNGQSAGAMVNIGGLFIFPRSGIGSPGLSVSNRFFLHNQGFLYNLKDAGNGGILNNFGVITNGNTIVNAGFLHNSGPKVSPTAARLTSTRDGVLYNLGTIENFGLIEGRVDGECPGNCK